ncbi:hypothetical protein, partial [Yersinia ruckeri]|uniref:hypothetical protein n=1 Tax=Yersinia ruckeri TaxID=29486 RepID=UPI001CA358F5
GFNSFSQFGGQCLEFLFVHNLPVSVVSNNIPKTGNYTILITGSDFVIHYTSPTSGAVAWVGLLSWRVSV